MRNTTYAPENNMTKSRQALENLLASAPMEFHRELETWAAGEFHLDADNIDEITDKMLDAAPDTAGFRRD